MARIVGPGTDITRELRRIDASIAGGASDPAAPTRRSSSRRGAVVSDDVTAPGGILIDPSGAWPAPDVSTQMERPVLVSRQCSRSGCSESAAVTLTYNYERQQVWIDALLPEREPHGYDLCGRHADRQSVPNGWHLEDRRRLRNGQFSGLVAV